jgi:hypothetical protein
LPRFTGRRIATGIRSRQASHSAGRAFCGQMNWPSLPGRHSPITSSSCIGKAPATGFNLLPRLHLAGALPIQPS